jgi:DNA polymerase-3 subunit alpha
MCNFGHLHVHTEYSTLDGQSKASELMEVAASMGQQFIAITDHGSTSGLYEAQVQGDKHGVKVIHGTEFYYVREVDGENGHLLVLAKDNVGLRNIFRMQRWAYKHNFHRKPRITWDILEEHKEGLIVTSACLGSPFNQYLIQDDFNGALEWAKRAKSVFGDDFYIELQPNQIPEQHMCNEAGIRIAKQLGIRLVGTNDVHYTYEQDCFPHEVMLAMQIKKKMSDEKRFKFSTNDFWLKSEEEMLSTFDLLPPDIVREALENTKHIADKCNARIEKGNYLPPYYDVPEGKTERSMLVEKVMAGAREMNLNKNKSFMEDVQNEIDVIDRNGYSGYFLIVEDYVNTARKASVIVGDGRGSGAGSKVAYLTGITKIAPHQFDLLFERFMADGRQPDFDVDFSDQDFVFQDLQNKHGVENVARIVANGTLTPKAVIRKVMNTFDHPMQLQNQITKLVPDLCPSLEEAYQHSPQLLDYKKKYPVEWSVIERLEGIVSHESQHAGGVVIYPNLGDYVPLTTKGKDKSGYIAAWDKYVLETLGFYKFDILGLETLPVVRRTLDSIFDSTGVMVDLHEIDYEDQSVYDMLCAGDVSGVFQITAQSAKVMEQQPRNFRDLIAINALIRPGVGDWNEYIERRRGKDWHKDPHRPWMHETLGTMTYQEQFLLDAHKLCGWSIADADKIIRKGKNLKQNKEVMDRFIGDGMRSGHNGDYMEAVWHQICDAQGDYSFNKSHSASYAMLSYQTAWLKCYYPAHFYASLMSSEKTDGDGQDAISGYIHEVKQRGIQVEPPNINISSDRYIVGSNSSILYKINTISHVGDSAVKWIMDNRPFASFEHFMEVRKKSEIKQNVLVNLIKAGCFDFDNPDRGHLLWLVDMENRTKTQVKKEFVCDKYEFDDKIKAEWEMQVLGTYLSTHPMERFGFKPLTDYKDGESCIQGGEVYDLNIFNDKKGKEMCFAFINTLYGNVKVLVFSSVWAKQEHKVKLEIGNLVMIKGRRSGNDIILNDSEVLT